MVQDIERTDYSAYDIIFRDDQAMNVVFDHLRRQFIYRCFDIGGSADCVS